MLTLVSNPRQRRPARSKRTGRFLKRHNPEANPEANPHRKRKRSVHRKARGPTRRRNPFGLEKTTEQLYGVGMTEIAAAGLGVVGSEIVGAKLDEMVGSSWAVTPPTGNVFDLMYVIRRTLPRAAAAAGLTWLAKMGKLPREVVRGIGIGGAAGATLQAVGASRLLPDVVKDGSLLIGQRQGPPMRELPPPSGQFIGGGMASGVPVTQSAVP